eukprot:2773098-Pyramimonas_sp.AAC.2
MQLSVCVDAINKQHERKQVERSPGTGEVYSPDAAVRELQDSFTTSQGDTQEQLEINRILETCENL